MHRGSRVFAGAAAAAVPWPSLCLRSPSAPSDVRQRRVAPPAAPSCCCAEKPVATVDRRDLVRFKGGLQDFHATYEVWDELGHGAYGTVDRARHKASGILRAVKHVKHVHLQSTKWEHLQPEVEALADLDHPSIVRLVEYYDTGEDLFLVEELCAGGTLEQWLAECAGGRVNCDTAAWLVRQMLRAIWCCHLHGSLIHRDLKADNFMFGAAGDLNSLKLIDFGAAMPMATFGQRGGGALASCAPELLRGCSSCGPDADVWSLGVLLFRMLTGQHLLSDISSSTARLRRWLTAESVEEEVVRKVCDGEYISRRLAHVRRDPAISSEACDLLEAMLKQDPAARISAIRALRHPFVLASYSVHPRGDAVFDEQVVEKMRRFASSPALRRLALLVEAHLLAPHDEPLLSLDYLSFRAADVRDRGVLTAADISAALQGRGLDVPGDLVELCCAADMNGDGKLSLVEFIAATASPEVSRRQRFCRATFRALDADGDGRITAGDLEVLLKPGPARADAAVAVIREVDVEEVGGVDLERFVKLMRDD